jgi:anti-sigma-K factor RskA
MSSNRLPHAMIEELVAADALDGLDELDRARLEAELGRHGATCLECRRLIREYTEVAGQLSALVGPVSLSEDAEARLVALALAPSGPQAETEARAPTPIRRRPGGVRRWAAVAAAAAVIGVGAGAIGYGLAPGRGPAVPAGFAAFVARPDTRVVTFPARDGQQVAVAFHPGERGSWVIASGLPDLPGGKVYELWHAPSAIAGVRPAGLFVPKDGTAVAPTDVGQSVALLAVSVEPAGGSAQPTTTPIFVTKVPPA